MRLLKKASVMLVAMFIQSLCEAQESLTITVNAEAGGHVYLDGEYTGKTSPAILSVAPGQHTLSVGYETPAIYLKKQVNLLRSQTVTLDRSNKVKPKVWKALFVGVPETRGEARDIGLCSTNYSKTELDQAFEFFKMNLKTQIEPFSMGTVEWQIERRDLTQPVDLQYNQENDWFTLEAEQSLAEFNDIQSGQYDTIFYFWREEQGRCSFKSGYFGLAWLDPWSERTKKTGYVTVKFNSGNIGVQAQHDWYRSNDPGVWTHEWLHVVIERFYPLLNVKTPLPPKDVLILHAAQAYSYQYPWMVWYKDLISGRVKLGNGYSGIGPEALLSCNIRDVAKNRCELKLN